MFPIEKMNHSENQSDLMQVLWNGKPEWVRPSSNVECLLTQQEWEDCLAGKAVISDSQGHEVHMTGALCKGDSLFLRYLKNQNSEKKT